MDSFVLASREPAVSVATLNIAELAPAPLGATASASAEAKAKADAVEQAEARLAADLKFASEANPAVDVRPMLDVKPAAALKPVAEVKSAAVAVGTAVAEPSPAPVAHDARKEDPREDPGAERKPSPLLVRASARATDRSEDAHTRLTAARSAARDHATDARALRAWAVAAMRSGETREARRAAEAWAIHDNTAEPRLFLASALETSGRKREARAVLEEWLANHPDASEAKRMLSHLGGAPEPAIKRSGRGRVGRGQLHPPDPVTADE